jgi:periplasmic protein TonB
MAGAAAAALAATPRGRVLLLVIICHVGGLLALLAIAPSRILPEEPKPLEVRLVKPELPPPPPPAPVDPEIPLAEDTPPPQWLPEPQLELAVQEPEPDLPPPVFRILASSTAAMPRLEPSPPPAPAPPQKPLPAKPPQQQPPREATPPPKPPTPAIVDTVQPAPSFDPRSVLKTVTEADIRYRVPPQPIYPAYAKRAGEFGSTVVSVLIDVSGRPLEVSVEKSSSFTALDREALPAVRDALLEPHLEAGAPQPVRVSIPIHFLLVRER